MKIANMLAAAGLVVASLGVSTAADAQRYDRHNHRGYNGWHHDRGRHNGWNHHRRCHTEWHHHHRVTRCY